MNDGSRLAGNIITVALLLIAVVATFDGLQREEVCLQTTFAFYSGQCPVEATADKDVLTITANTTLRGSHRGPIVIESDGVTLNCASHEIKGNGAAGISVVGRTGVTIADCRVTGFEAGVMLTETANTRVVGNIFEGSTIGIRLERSDRNEIRDNHTNLTQTGIWLDRSDSNQVLDNRTDRGITAIGLSSGSSDNRIRGNRIVDAGRAIWIDVGSDNTIEANQVHGRGNSGGGLSIGGSNSRIVSNEIGGAGVAIDISGSDATVSENHVEDAGTGISASGANHRIGNNTVEVRSVGIVISGSEHVVFDNTITGGSGAGLLLRNAVDSTLTENRVVDAAVGLLMDTSRNNLVRSNDLSEATRGIDGLAVTVENTFELNAGLGLTEPLVVNEDTILTEDHEGTIVFGADNIRLDCAGHQVLPQDWQGGGAIEHEVGITIEERRGVTIQDCEVVGYEQAITLWQARDSTLVGNTGALVLNGSHSTHVSDHSAPSITLFSSHRNRIADSLVTKGDIRTTESDKNQIEDNTLARGVAVVGGSRNVVSGNRIADGRIHIRVSTGNVVRANTVNRKRGSCIMIGQVATDNLIADNIATGCRIGFAVNNSEGNTITGNIASDNVWGFKLTDARENTFTGNVSESPVNLDRDRERNTFTNNEGFE